MVVGPVVAVGRHGSSPENGCSSGGNDYGRCGVPGTVHLPKKKGRRQVQQSQMWWAR